MKHKVTVEVKTRKHFLGIPYTAVEKKHIMVDGKTYRTIKQKKEQSRAMDEAVAAAMVVLEEEECI